MLTAFRRLSKSTIGTIITAMFGVAILASFAMGDIANLRAGNLGMSSSTLAKAGSEEVSDRDMSQAMERRLQQVRQQNPEAGYPAIAGDFDALLTSLVDERSLAAFADKFGFHLSKRLVDAEIAQIPQTKGLDGKFNDKAYQAFLAQQRLTDQEVRQVIAGSLYEKMLLTPIATNARLPVGIASPYAAMLLEARLGEVMVVPTGSFRAGLKPTDADLQRFYAQNRGRYMVPEQRTLRLARIGPDQVAGAVPSEAEIAAYYNANQTTYATKDVRTISQAVVPDRKVAEQIAARAKAGGSFVAAAAPAGLAAADVTVGPQTREQFAGIAGNAPAAAAFGAASGAVVGPIQSDLGWHVIKVEAIKTQSGKSLAAAHGEIVTKLTADKRKGALTDLVTKIENALDDGRNFTEAAALGKLTVVETPLITATGVSRTNAAFKLPAELAAALKSGFELQPSDEPVVENAGADKGFVLVAPAQIVPAAAAPLASIRDQVAGDWVMRQAIERAKAVATAIAAKAQSMPLAQAAAGAGIPLPPIRPIGARRIQLAQLGDKVPPPLRMLFNLGAGKSRMVADPAGQGFYVVKLTSVTPGNPLSQPALIGQVQRDFQEAASQEYAQQFVAALRASVGVKRNDSAIAAAKARITQ